MLVTLSVGQLRGVIRAEVAAMKNGHAPAKLLYSTEEAADLCGVPKTWLAAAARSGKVKCRRLGVYVRFSLDDLQELIEQAEKNGRV